MANVAKNSATFLIIDIFVPEKLFTKGLQPIYQTGVKIHSGIDGLNISGAVVTIGMFDGLHLGHKQLLQTTIDKAKNLQAPSVIITFWPHPRLVLGKEGESLRFLTSLEEKTTMFSTQGIDHLIIVPFTPQLASLTAAQFVQQVLVQKLNMRHLVVGYNHRFGSDGFTNPPDYKQLGNQFGFDVTILQAVMLNDVRASSSQIRYFLNSGNIADANKLLGYRYLVSGRVVGGQRLGRTIGFPTANIEVEEPAKLIPLDGVYACKVHTLGRQYNGMLNIGYRPTVSKQLDFRTIEVHILDFHADIYSEEVVIEFVERVRNEMQFENIEALKLQLLADEKTVRVLLS